jgi:hypothetical protein
LKKSFLHPDILTTYSQNFNGTWKLENVQNRSLILFHPTNNALLKIEWLCAPVTKLSGKVRVDVQAFISLKTIVYKALDNNRKC